MTGIEEYEYKLKNQIDNLIKGNQDKYYLKGFYYFIKNSNLNELSSQYNYLLHIVKFMNFTNKDLQHLTVDDYTIYLGNNEDKSSSYRIVMYASLKKFSEYLYANNINTSNPMQFIKRPKYKETTETKRKRDNGYMSLSEVKRFKEAINDGVGSMEARHKQESWIERDKAIIDVFLTTGIRLSALYKLDVTDVNLETGYISVKEKGSKYRTIKLCSSSVNILNDWINKREQLLNDSSTERALFISNRRRRISTPAISNIIVKYGSVIEGKNITPHKLRHTFGTQLYTKTKDINLTKNALGHSNIHTTELYINGTEEETNIVASVIEGLY